MLRAIQTAKTSTEMLCPLAVSIKCEFTCSCGVELDFDRLWIHKHLTSYIADRTAYAEAWWNIYGGFSTKGHGNMHLDKQEGKLRISEWPSYGRCFAQGIHAVQHKVYNVENLHEVE